MSQMIVEGNHIVVEGTVIKLTPTSGRLVDVLQWSEAVARGLAKIQGIAELTDEHFMVINCLRSNNGSSSDMYLVMEHLRTVMPDWQQFKKLFPKRFPQACIISGCEEP